jgi:D-alanyl-D-alanine carboxypeptidase/D-alanyl-D-alanine-endopeptidase (penicillin-binding protein 4)
LATLIATGGLAGPGQVGDIPVFASAPFASAQAAQSSPAGLSGSNSWTAPAAQPALAAPNRVTPVAELLDPAAPLPAPGAIRGLAGKHLGAEQVGTASVSVRDLESGEELFSASPNQALPPASTMKLLTATAAMEVLGPDATLTTAAVLTVTGARSGIVTLVAGGDTTLSPAGARTGEPVSRAGLGDLAWEAAVELRRRGVEKVQVRLDDTIFSGPAVYPDWEWSLGTTWGAPTTPLAIMGGRAGPVFDASTYLADPALAAADHFRGLLASAGRDASLALPLLAVTGTVARAATPAQSEPLAQIESAPVRELVAYMLRHSNNNLAESLGRMTALALGRPGSFEGCSAAVSKTLAGLNLVVASLRMDDCSGLSHGSTVSAATLTSVLALSGDSDASELGLIARNLPTAALQGTLTERFQGTLAAGNLRAKTGTLTGVTALAGTVQTAGGRELVFAVIANPGDAIWTDSARQSIDRFVAGLAALA